MIEYRVSSYCSLGDCVEAGTTPKGAVAVRDSKDKTGTPLEFTRAEWLAFVQGVKAGEFDDLGR